MGEKYQRRGVGAGSSWCHRTTGLFLRLFFGTDKIRVRNLLDYCASLFLVATISHRHSPGPPPRSRANAKRSLGRVAAVSFCCSLLVLALPTECSCRRKERGSERDLTLRALSNEHGTSAPGHTVLLTWQRSGGCRCLSPRTKARHSAGIPSYVPAPLPGIGRSVLERRLQRRKARQNRADVPILPRAQANPCSARVRGPKASAKSPQVPQCPAKEIPMRLRQQARVLRSGYK